MPKLFLSKSKYCALRQCPKLAWLQKYKPEEQTITPDLQARFDAGNEIGDLAMGLSGDFVEVTAYKGEKLDLADELADVLWVVAAIANQTGTDLTEALHRNLDKKTRRDATRHKDNPRLRKPAGD